jgi:hypothetical protein
MSRYVILKHETMYGVHFDFMLEVGGTLKTWSLPQPPSPGMEMDAEALPDHRIAYLDYEGAVSGNRGTVARWDSGTYEVENQSETETVVRLTGEKLIARAMLRRIDPEETRWQYRLL